MEKFNIDGKIFGVFGLGITGISSYEYLTKHGKEVFCWDDNEQNRIRFKLKHADAKVLDISENSWNLVDYAVVSPGVPRSHKIFSLAKKLNFNITSDIELFLKQCRDKNIIAVTGTNGKSTTVSLIYHILKNSNQNYLLGGNIGKPVLSLPKDADGYILELSSFQLDLLHELSPTASILLNISEDHLDRYSSYEEYKKSKYKILQNDGLKVIGIDNDNLSVYFKKIKQRLGNDGKFLPISGRGNIKKPKEKGIICNEGQIIDSFFDDTSLPMKNNPHLLGKHNNENIAAAYAICRFLGLKPTTILTHISTFQSLDHRMQYLGEKRGVKYYNDSKGTNTNSTSQALSSFDNIYWLAGGVFKEKNIKAIEKYLPRIKKAYLFGRDADIIAQHLGDKINYELFDDMSKAFNKAKIDAEKRVDSSGNIILLSPTCASTDQFKNFEDRGDQFKHLYEKA
ncbi:MAG TPA: UDP-N-acetylmuramoyl-L-alanine--D-glutamate ligase [Candidatus Megaira endosymbiont of Nemacystus decipiens]|nr:UDP-N-acetylmuramoyl-L-alanine--D-glutamate ligase [Candidatus Megaera endosymbiont of Nemacystus decipiens]